MQIRDGIISGSNLGLAQATVEECIDLMPGRSATAVLGLEGPRREVNLRNIVAFLSSSVVATLPWLQKLVSHKLPCDCSRAQAA